MKLSSSTSINDLLKAYPFLVDFLVAYNPQFRLLKNKVMRATVGKMATLKQVASIGEVPLDTLIKDITAEIENRTGETGEAETEKKGEVFTSGEKTAKLKQIIIDLHQ